MAGAAAASRGRAREATKVFMVEVWRVKGSIESEDLELSVVE
jgi:hypothetical protein